MTTVNVRTVKSVNWERPLATDSKKMNPSQASRDHGKPLAFFWTFNRDPNVIMAVT